MTKPRAVPARSSSTRTIELQFDDLEKFEDSIRCIEAFFDLLAGQDRDEQDDNNQYLFWEMLVRPHIQRLNEFKGTLRDALHQARAAGGQNE